MHRAATALAQTGFFTENLSHHAVHVSALGNAVAMAAVGGLDHIILPQGRADAGGDGFLADVGMCEAGDLSCQEIMLHALLELADGAHGLVKVQCLLLGVFLTHLEYSFHAFIALN